MRLRGADQEMADVLLDPVTARGLVPYSLYLADLISRPSRRMLDVGFGSIDRVDLLASVAHEFVGVDLDPDRVRAASETFRRIAPGAAMRFVVGDATRMDLGAARFDVITCSLVLELISDDQKAACLEGCRHHGAPGATYWFTTPNRSRVFRPGHMDFLAPKEFLSLLNGRFGCVRTWGVTPRDPRLHEIERERHKHTFLPLPNRLVARAFRLIGHRPSHPLVRSFIRHRMARTCLRSSYVITDDLDDAILMVACCQTDPTATRADGIMQPAPGPVGNAYSSPNT